MIEFCLDLIITITLYVHGPLLFAHAKKRPTTSGRLKGFCIGYTSLVWLLLNAAKALLFALPVGSMAPAVLWGTISYYVARSVLDRRGRLLPPGASVTAAPKASPKTSTPAPGKQTLETDKNHHTPVKPSDDANRSAKASDTSAPIAKDAATSEEPPIGSNNSLEEYLANWLESQRKSENLAPYAPLADHPLVEQAPPSPVSMAPETLGEVPDSAPVNSDVQPGATLEARPKIRRWISVLTIVLVVVVAAMTAALTYVTGQLNTAKADLAAANSDLISVRSQLSTVTANLDKTRNQAILDKAKFQRELNNVEERLDEVEPAYYFLHNRIGFIVSGSSYYHDYDCPTFNSAPEFWAHNIEYCQYLGYSACQNCW